MKDLPALQIIYKAWAAKITHTRHLAMKDLPALHITNYKVWAAKITHTHTQLRSFPGVYTTCTRRTACPSNLKNTEWKPYTYKCKPGNPLNNAFASCNLICSSQPSVQALHLHRSFISICVPLKQQQRRASTRVW